jgi:hypothetical protein
MDRPETSMTGERIEGEEQNDLGGTLRPTGRALDILQAFEVSNTHRPRYW